MEKTPVTVDRNPAVAGKFYPADKNELRQELKMLFDSASPLQSSAVRAIICPHAGYIFSGKIMASAFNQIDNKRRCKRVFIIGSSHHKYFNKAAVYCDGDFIMPYGKEKVDTEFGKMLVEKFPEFFTDDRSSHLSEHSIEVLLPFLQFKLKNDYVIIPILLGTSQSLICKQIASILKPYFTDENLFIISSDFSHYPKYEDAKKVDTLTKNAICANNPEFLLTQLTENDRNDIPNLATSLCGWTSVLTLLYITSTYDSLEFHAIV
jgi:AmmeMemoRadiSam system protein B